MDNPILKKEGMRIKDRSSGRHGVGGKEKAGNTALTGTLNPKSWLFHATKRDPEAMVPYLYDPKGLTWWQ